MNVILHCTPPTLIGTSPIRPSACVTAPEAVLYVSDPETICMSPNSLTTAAAMTDMDAPVSTRPSIRQLLISTDRCKVLLLCVLLTQILLTTGTVDTIETWTPSASASFFLRATFTKFSSCFNSPRIIITVSIGVREIFPLIKWERIFDLTKCSRFMTVPSSATLADGPAPAGVNSTGCLRLGNRVYENTFSFSQNLLSYSAVAASSSNSTSRKFATPELDLLSLGFFQHLSSECPRPKQNEHFTPQLFVLWGMPHLAHLGHGS